MSDSWWPHGLYSPCNFPGQNTSVGILSFLQGIFPTQRSNPGLPHCRQILYQLSHQGSPTGARINHNSHWATLTICWLFVFMSPWLFLFSGMLCFTGSWVFWIAILQTPNREFSDGTMNKNPPANTGHAGLTPGLGRSHMPWINKARASYLLKPMSPRAYAVQWEKPLQWEARTPPQRPSTTKI